mmetsp:Transcript_35703/g.81439  ORF Transcript_35703/g.81439 Transcript_35703/m.81439 type:complete len:145 (+) Transcript_35703:88-522(+)
MTAAVLMLLIVFAAAGSHREFDRESELEGKKSIHRATAHANVISKATTPGGGSTITQVAKAAMSPKFNAVHQKHLEKKAKGQVSKTFIDEESKKAAHLVDVLPYVLPPAGLFILVTLGLTVCAVRRWQVSQGGATGMRPLGPGR